MRSFKLIVKLFIVAVTVLFLAMLSACENNPTALLNFGLASLPSNLDPLYATDATSSRIDRLLYQRLVSFDETKRVIPGIANMAKCWRAFVVDAFRLMPFHNMYDGINRY